MGYSFDNKKFDSLYEAVLSLKNLEECRSFFEDLCTVAELRSFNQRLSVAKMLDNKHVYTDIAARTGASSATISRVSRSLIYGSGGYRLVLDRLKQRGESGG